MTESPNPGYTFRVWGGDGSGTGTTRSLTVTSNTEVTATFTQDHYTLTVNVVGAGCSVSKNPDQATYTYGSSVALTPTAAPGWTFIGFSANVVGGSVTVNSNTEVTATFTQDHFKTKLTVQCNPEAVPESGGSVYFTGKLTTEDGSTPIGGMTITIEVNTGDGFIQRGVATTNDDGTYTTELSPWNVSPLNRGFYVVQATFESTGNYLGKVTTTTSGAGNGGLIVLPEYALAGLAALGACLAGFVVYKKRSSLPHLKLHS